MTFLSKICLIKIQDIHFWSDYWRNNRILMSEKATITSWTDMSMLLAASLDYYERKLRAHWCYFRIDLCMCSFQIMYLEEIIYISFQQRHQCALEFLPSWSRLSTESIDILVQGVVVAFFFQGFQKHFNIYTLIYQYFHYKSKTLT